MRPTNMVETSNSFPLSERVSVIPVESPTVENAEMTSNADARNVGCPCCTDTCSAVSSRNSSVVISEIPTITTTDAAAIVPFDIRCRNMAVSDFPRRRARPYSVRTATVVTLMDLADTIPKRPVHQAHQQEECRAAESGYVQGRETRGTRTGAMEQRGHGRLHRAPAGQGALAFEQVDQDSATEEQDQRRREDDLAVQVEIAPSQGAAASPLAEQVREYR